MFRALWIFCAVALCRGGAGAEFSWQLTGDRQRDEVADVFDSDDAGLGATYHFRAVDDQRGPYALAAFINRSSRLGIFVRSEEQRQHISFTPIFGTPTTITSVDESTRYTLSGRYVWMTSGWYAGGSVTRGDGDPPSSTCLHQDRDLRGVGVTAGRYVGAWTSIELGWTATDLETRIDLLCSFSPPSLAPLQPEQETRAADLGVLHVGHAGRLTYALTGRVSSSRGELTVTPAPIAAVPGPTGPVPPIVVIGGVGIAPLGSVADFIGGRFRSYAIGGELFPTMRLGVRLGYTRWGGDPVRDYAYELAATWFFRGDVAARFGFARARQDLPVSLRDQDSVSLQLIGRF